MNSQILILLCLLSSYLALPPPVEIVSEEEAALASNPAEEVALAWEELVSACNALGISPSYYGLQPPPVPASETVVSTRTVVTSAEGVDAALEKYLKTSYTHGYNPYSTNYASNPTYSSNYVSYPTYSSNYASYPIYSSNYGNYPTYNSNNYRTSCLTRHISGCLWQGALAKRGQ